MVKENFSYRNSSLFDTLCHEIRRFESNVYARSLFNVSASSQLFSLRNKHYGEMASCVCVERYSNSDYQIIISVTMEKY